MSSPKTVALGLGLGFFLQVAPAVAWWQWYYQDIPYAPVPGMWLYQALPQGPGPGQPYFWQYQSFPQGVTSVWSSAVPMSGLYVEQAQSPAGYQVRVYSGQPAAQDIRIGAEGGALVVRRVSAGWGGQQAGWMTQWVALPADANLAAMRMRRGNGVLEIFIPRFG